MRRKILNGWKEISNHIQRAVRTAQRWEAHLGMPVYRPALKDRSAVVAFSDELDGWMARTAPKGAENNESTLAWHTTELASQARALQDQLQRSLAVARGHRELNSLSLQLDRMHEEVEGLHEEILRLQPGTRLDSAAS